MIVREDLKKSLKGCHQKRMSQKNAKEPCDRRLSKKTDKEDGQGLTKSVSEVIKEDCHRR